jgi:hypothetical protein
MKSPSVAVMKLSKAELTELCDTFRAKAQQAHHEARMMQTRALLAESRLAILRAAYEPASTPTNQEN